MVDEPNTPIDSETELASAEGDLETPQATNEQDAPDGSPSYEALQQQYLRLAADFDNFRKRQAQEREALFKYGAQNTLEVLLPVLDNLERAQKSLSATSDPALLFKSFEMLASQLQDTLTQVGLEKMAPQSQAFDPEKHEAISHVETTDVPELHILEVYQAGYKLRDRVLRPAQVVVAKAPAASEETNPSPSFNPDNISTGMPNPFAASSSSESVE